MVTTMREEVKIDGEVVAYFQAEVGGDKIPVIMTVSEEKLTGYTIDGEPIMSKVDDAELEEARKKFTAKVMKMHEMLVEMNRNN